MQGMGCFLGRLGPHSLRIRSKHFEYFVELSEFAAKGTKQALNFANLAHVPLDVCMRLGLNFDRSGGRANRASRQIEIRYTRVTLR